MMVTSSSRKKVVRERALEEPGNQIEELRNKDKRESNKNLRGR